MSINIEHQKIVDFVNGFKEANKQTVEKIRTYDPKLRCWTYEKVKTDENAAKFHEEQVNKSKSKKVKEKRKKTNVAKEAQEGNKKSEMELNVVHLKDIDKNTFKKIADMYDTSQSTVIRAYYKKKHENIVNA